MATLPLLLNVHEMQSYDFMTTWTISRLTAVIAISYVTWNIPFSHSIEDVGGSPTKPKSELGFKLRRNGTWLKTSTHGLWLLWSFFLAIGLVRQAFQETDRLENTSTRNDYEHNLAVAFLCSLLTGLMLLISFAPYLGIKTQATFSMFSNLRVEGGKTNHFLYRPWMAVFDLLEDICVVTGSNLERIRFYMQISPLQEEYTHMRPLIQRLKLGCSNHGNSRYVYIFILE